MRTSIGTLCLLASLLGCHAATREPESLGPGAEASDSEQPAMRALAWADGLAKRWRAFKAVDDQAGCQAIWAEVAGDIERQADPELRTWMLTAQFLIGRGGPRDPLSRAAIAEAALAELSLDDRHWSIAANALATAAWETGRWATLRPELDARIATQVPDVAAYLALELYIGAASEGDWEQAETTWSRWLARPELAQTPFGPRCATRWRVCRRRTPPTRRSCSASTPTNSPS